MKRLRLIYGLLLGAASLTGSAYAADFAPVVVPPPVVVIEEARSWAGPYVGVLGGVSVSDFCNANNPDACPPDFEDPPYNHFVIGGFGGFNIQFNSVVLGLDAAVTVDMPYRFRTPNDDADVGIARAFLRLRAGYSLGDHALLYGTIGVAGMRHYWTNGDPDVGRGLGLTWGMGMEVRGDGPWSIRFDYAVSQPAHLHQARIGDPDFDLYGAGRTFTIGIAHYFGRR